MKVRAGLWTNFCRHLLCGAVPVSDKSEAARRIARSYTPLPETTMIMFLTLASRLETGVSMLAILFTVFFRFRGIAR